MIWLQKKKTKQHINLQRLFPKSVITSRQQQNQAKAAITLLSKTLFKL